MQVTQKLTLWQQVTDASPKIGDGWGYYRDAPMGEHERRDTFIERFGFAVPTPIAIKAVNQFVGQQEVLEVGAGTGLWARLLSDEGVSITAVDDCTFSRRRTPFRWPVFLDTRSVQGGGRR